MDMNTNVPQQTCYALFLSGAAIGSVLGMMAGFTLALWLGSGIVQAFQRALHRARQNDQPSFDLLLQ